MVKALSSPTGSKALPKAGSPVETNRFADFFKEKIANLRAKFMQAPGGELFIELDDQCHSNLHAFQEVCEDDEDRIIKSSPCTTCELYPLPTIVTKKCVSKLLPVITAMVNASISSGIVPCQFKTAIVTPLIKKAVSSPKDLKN